MTQAMFWQELLRAALTLLAGALVARLGLYFYFRQKEYETVKQRYLEQSVDLIASEIESVSRIFGHNWVRALEVLKLYRDLPASEFDLSELKSGFLELSTTNFQRIAHHRLSNLIRSDVVWGVYQLALSRHKTLNAKATIELTHGIRLHHSGQLKESRQDFIRESMELLKPLNDESDRYAALIAALQVIAAQLEQSSFRFKDISKFHEREPIKEAIGRLEQAFYNDLN